MDSRSGMPARIIASSSSSRNTSMTRRTPSGPSTASPPERGSAHEDGPRSQRERLEDVDPAANAAIQVDLGASRDRLHDGRQHLHAGRNAVEPAPAVGRDHDAAGAVLDRERRVLGMEYAFQDHGQPGQRPEPRHILPRKRGGLEGLLAQIFLDAGRVGAGGSLSSTRAKRSFLPHRGSRPSARWPRTPRPPPDARAPPRSGGRPRGRRAGTTTGPRSPRRRLRAAARRPC